MKTGLIFDHGLDMLGEIINHQDKYGTRRDCLGFAVTWFPQVLALSMEEFGCWVKFYLDMGMGKDDFDIMAFDYLDSMEDMNSKVFEQSSALCCYFYFQYIILET